MEAFYSVQIIYDSMSLQLNISLLWLTESTAFFFFFVFHETWKVEPLLTDLRRQTYISLHGASYLVTLRCRRYQHFWGGYLGPAAFDRGRIWCCRNTSFPTCVTVL